MTSINFLETAMESSRSRRIAARMRARVLRAFLRMARGAAEKAAYESTVAFYRSCGHAWTKHLGRA